MVRIVSDSTCDLSEELIDRYGIYILPLYVRLGDKEYLDGIDIKPEDLYKWSDEHSDTPKTAAPSVSDFMQIFDKDSDDEYVLFTISSDMSACNNNARLAAEQLALGDRLVIIDSQNLSTGIGHLVIEAAEMAERDFSAKEIGEKIEEFIPKVRASFVVDTLTYLYRGGRCSGLTALIGTAMKLHPKIAVEGGKMKPENKYRGGPKKYVMDYVKDLEEHLLKAKKDRVFITHSGCDKEVEDMVKQHIADLHHFDEILVTRAGSVVSSHCGPGTLGVLFISE